MKKFSKLLVCGVITSGILLSGYSIISASNTNIENTSIEERVVKVTINSNVAIVNDEEIIMDTEPYIQTETSSTMIPLRFVSNFLGIDDENILYDVVEKSATIIKGDDTLIFRANSNEYTKNGVTYTGVGITEIKNDRIHIPFRVLGEAFDLDIDWEANTKTAIMSTKSVNVTTEATTEITTEGTTAITEVTTEATTKVTTEATTEVTTKPTTEETTTTTISEKDIRAIEEEVVRLVNEERAKEGLSALKIDEDLMNLASLKSEDMYKNNYFDHTSPTYGSFSDMIKQFGISYRISGENIAMGQTTAEQVVNDWMNSEGHRANILNENFTYIGVGYCPEKNIWTQMFVGR